MLPRDTPTLPDDNIQVAGSGEFCAFSACDALRQMGEEGERPFADGVPADSPHLPENRRDHVRCGAGVREHPERREASRSAAEGKRGAP